MLQTLCLNGRFTFEVASTSNDRALGTARARGAVPIFTKLTKRSKLTKRPAAHGRDHYEESFVCFESFVSFVKKRTIARTRAAANSREPGTNYSAAIATTRGRSGASNNSRCRFAAVARALSLTKPNPRIASGNDPIPIAIAIVSERNSPARGADPL
jgi:hypothetical protein